MYTRAFWDSVYSRHFNDAPWLLHDWTAVGERLADEYIVECSGCRILDYGCGNASVTKRFMEAGAQVDLAEISSKMVNWLEHEYEKYGCNIYEVSTPGEISGLNCYDYIVAFGLFHHIEPDYWIEFLAAFHRLLKVSGKLLITGWDEQDEVLNRLDRKAPMTGEISWFITTLVDYVNPRYYKVLKNCAEYVSIYPFVQHRTVRCLVLEKLK